LAFSQEIIFPKIITHRAVRRGLLRNQLADAIISAGQPSWLVACAGFLPVNSRKDCKIMRFNLKPLRRPAPNTVNLAGGVAFTETPKLELASLLLTSTLTDKFYTSANQEVQRIKQLVVEQTDKRFVAKAAIYARREAGMRSVTHLVAAELAKQVKGEAWTANFLASVVRRPDDVLEILSCYLKQYGRPIPNSLKKGLGRALSGFDAYQLAKYRKEQAELSLVDAVNLLHPVSTEALAKLMKGELAPAETWETKLTQAGSDLAVKSAAWAELVKRGQLGYFALLRNLRNLTEHAPDCFAEIVQQLLNPEAIRKSLVMPFRFTTAYEALQTSGLPDAAMYLEVLSQAVDLSLANVPKFPGRTLVALDTSGSMAGRSIKIGALFAATLIKSNQADLMSFSADAEYLIPNRKDATLSLAQWIETKAAMSATNFHAIFQRASKSYDRIILLSDMQGWVGYDAPTQAFADYKQRTGSDPKVYSFDLAGHGTLMFPQRNIFCLAGFSDQTLATLQNLDSDPHALIRKIEAVAL
jgi:60 kDa SS-A/Ro ribonucleoprotein